MGCNFSQNTYFYPENGHLVHSPKPLHSQPNHNYPMLQTKARANLRIANRIYAQHYQSPLNSLLETDRDMCSFMKKTERHLEKSKLRIYQSENNTRRQIQLQIDKNQNPSNTTKRSQQSSKENHPYNQKHHQYYKSQSNSLGEAYSNPVDLVHSQIVLQQINIAEKGEQEFRSPQMLKFSIMQSINYSPRRKKQQLQAIQSMMERHLFLNSNKNAKHNTKKRQSSQHHQHNLYQPSHRQHSGVIDSSHQAQRIVTADGDLYQGALKNGSFQGKGILTKSNGSIYRGLFKKGKFEGMGQYHSRNGYSYQGQFSQNLPHGFGKAKYPDQCTYVGYYRRGIRHGKGLLTLADATYYGDFIEDQMEGKGLLLAANGYMYEGEWLAGMKHGKGKEQLQNGDSYVGQFEKDMKQGEGVMRYGDGSLFDGYWSKDKANKKVSSFRIKSSKAVAKTERRARRIL